MDWKTITTIIDSGLDALERAKEKCKKQLSEEWKHNSIINHNRASK